jgi:hypothetical protein
MILNITLPIIPFPDQSDEDLLNKVKIEELQEEDAVPNYTTFYTVNAISPFRTPYGDYTIVYSGGTEFLCTYSHGELYDKLTTIYTKQFGPR